MKYKFPLFILLALSAVFFLYAYVREHGMDVLDPKGVIALAEKNLIVTTTLLMLIVVIPVFILTFFFAWRYRASNTKATYAPDWHSNKILEVVWWAIPSAIILVLAIITWKSSHDLDPFKPLDVAPPPITIQVVALNWKWLFIYPEQNIAIVNFVQFPEDVPIKFQITADAPMNSFWIPRLAGQIYAMAGMETNLYLMATEAGEYAGLSSNYSGFGFSGMKFVAKASSQTEFDEWVDTVRQSRSVLGFGEYEELAQKSKNNPVTHYSSVVQGLYDTIIKKFMAPAKTPTPMLMSEMEM